MTARAIARESGLARNFIAALARAQHDQLVRERLADDFGRARRRLAERLPLGSDETDLEAAGLLQALLVGALAQTMVDRDLVSRGAGPGRAGQLLAAR